MRTLVQPFLRPVRAGPARASLLGALVLALVLAALAGPARGAPGLVAAYSFDEGSGGTVADSSGNGRTGTVVGPAWTAGRFGAALDFDGSNDRVDLPGLGTFYDTGFTFEAWVKKRTTKRDVAVLGSWVTGQNGGPMLWVDHVAGRYYQTLNKGLSNYLDSGRTPAPNVWQHLAAAYDGTTARFYVDGVHVASRAFSGNVGDSNTWRIGAYGPGPGGFFDGVIDEVRIYERALTAAEIQQDRDASIGLPDTQSPSTPTNFGTGGATATTLPTDWTPSTDNVGVAGYNLYRDGVRIAVTAGVGYTFTGLACETPYALGVEAFDAAGNVSGRATLAVSTATCGPDTPPAGLVAAYAFDEGAGPMAMDASGNDHMGTVIGAAWTNGRFGSALSFGGSGDRVDLSGLGVFYDAGFTYEAWVKKRTSKVDVAVVGSWVGSESGGPMIWVDHLSGRYHLTLNTGTLASYLDSGRAPVVGQWQHLAATYDGVVARFYVDGQEVASKVFTGNVGDSNTWRIGAYGPGPTGFFDGDIDEVRVYDRALGATEIQLDMARSVGPPDTTPPTVPAHFAKTGATATTITTSWSASSDDVGVAGYNLYRDGVAISSTTGTAYTFSALACAVSYDLAVAAFDDAGNESDRALLTASTSECDTIPPAVAISAPAAGANLTGTITVSADASDEDAVVGVRFELDGQPLGAEDTSAPFAVSWDTRTAANGSHLLTASAGDPSGNVSAAAPVTVNVNNAAPPPPGLVAAYAFDEGVGTIAGDASGNGRSGGIQGAGWAVGRFGFALSFDGVNDRVDLASLGTFYRSAFTFEAWVKKQGTKRDVAVLGTWTSGENGGPMLWVDHLAGRYHQTLNKGFANYLDSGRTPAVGTWQHLATTYDGSVARFYVDGVELASRSFSGNVGDSSTWRIGAYGATAAGFFDGLIDEVRVYDRALSQAAIQSDMGTAVGGPDTTPPTTPTGFAKTGATESTIAASWNASSDNVAVAGYDVYRDGARVGSTDGTTFTFAGLTCGSSYELGVEAFDSAGNTSARVLRTEPTKDCDTIPPTVAITAPSSGATVAGTIQVAAGASDNDAVAGVRFELDGTLLEAEDTTAPYEISWNTRAVSGGPHTLTAIARDLAGNTSTSGPVSVTVDNSGVPTVGLVAAYSFDDGAGATASDESGNGNAGTVSGAGWTVGRFGTALSFDGVDDWVTVPDADELDVTSALTLEAWVLPVGLGSTWRTVLMKEQSSNLVYGLYGNTSTGVPSAHVFVDGTEVDTRGSSAVPIGDWTHLAATYDGSELRLYVNGVLASAKAVSGLLPASSAPLRIGGNAIWPEWFRGRIDEVRIYDRALSQSEIQLDLDTAVGRDTSPPTVLATSPAPGASDVNVGAPITAAFNEAMDPSSLSSATFELRDSGGTLVPGEVMYDAASATASLEPSSALAFGVTYTATLSGGATGPVVKDRAGNALVNDHAWSFTTESSPAPILLVGSGALPYSEYPAEILRAEGLNDFTQVDLSLLTPGLLGSFDVVVLGETPLTQAQADMLGDWVAGGGNLVALRPDKRLAGLLGLVDAGSTLSNSYLRIDTSTQAGAGLAGETIQFHGVADRYTLDGAAAIATLYSTATAATSNPAVTLRDVGSEGGQAAAFTFDLARSIVFTRQGNPAWVGQERDGIGTIRPNDLFFGAATGDPQPDWVDVNKLHIPQADEQQRLLANLITTMAGDRKPLPRFWYLPRGEKAAIVMTGDDHGLGGTAGRLDLHRAQSPAGCSVAEWECVRSTSYIYPESPLTPAQAAAYVADGFEVAVHVNTRCSNWTPQLLEGFYTDQLDQFAARYAGVPAPASNRTHCVAWSDWATQPKVELAHGIRFDTNYYHYPGSWIGSRPGFMTGSGLVMRFADLDGSIIDVYQAHTHMTDESSQPYPATVNALLDKALGPEGYYGIFTANMHTDHEDSSGSDAIVSAALGRSVPVVSARQMLEWVDGRNASSFRDFSWDGTTLGFTIRVGAGANGLQAMLPMAAGGKTLASITRGGSPVTFTTQTVKGIEYAVFAAGAGRHAASYGP